MTNNFWKASTRDKVKDGTFLGGILATGIVFGEKVVNFITDKIPSNWLFIDNASLNVSLYIIGTGLLLGYLVDKY